MKIRRKKKFEFDKRLILAIGMPIVFVLAVAAYLLGKPTTAIISILCIGTIAVVLPYLSFDFIQFRDVKQSEKAFPNFLRDLAQAKSAGMTIPQAVATCAATNYGALSKYVRRLHTWLSWGIPFPEAWQKFTTALGRSDLIKRVNGVILESFFAGGAIESTLNSLASRVGTLKQMDEQKKSIMQTQIIIMYLVYVGFLFIIVALYKILLPVLYVQQMGTFAGVQATAVAMDMTYFKNLFFMVAIVESVCTGLIAGQIVEERLIAGFKHIALMLIVGISVFMIFIYPPHLSMDVFMSTTTPSTGEVISVGGSVYFEETPAAGAIVSILLEGQEPIIVAADETGRFQSPLTSPSESGKYDIHFTVTYEKIVKSTTQSIFVQ